MKLSIIIPFYNRIEKLERLLDSIPDEGDEIILVDDGSEEFFNKKGCRVIDLFINCGPAYARNRGAEFATNEVLLFLDSDVVLHKDTLKKIKEYMSGNIQVVCGDYDIEPINNTPSAWFKSLLTASWRPKYDRTSIFLARCGAIRKKLFLELGGFDEKLKVNEEWSLSQKISKLKLIMCYDPTILVKHEFPTFWNGIKNTFLRTYEWTRVNNKLTEDCTSSPQVITQVLGVLTPFHPIIFLLYAILNHKLFGLSIKYKGSIFTSFVTLPLSIIYAQSIVLGGICGLLRRLF